MAEQEKNKKKKGWLFLLLGIILAAGVATVLALTLGKNNPGPGGPGDDLQRSAEEIALAEKLAAEGSDTISIDHDIEIVGTLVVFGDKTLTGNGRIISKGSGEYVITLGEGAVLNLDGPSVESEEGGATNGIYVSETASFNLLSGSVRNLVGHGVRNLGAARILGGTISEVGTNWLMVDSGSTVEMKAGTFSDAGEAGVLIGSSATFTYGGEAVMDGSVDNLVYNLGTFTADGGKFLGNLDYALYNNGIMDIKNVVFEESEILGPIHNGEDGVMTVSSVTMKDSETDFIFNEGDLTLTDVTFGNCNNQAIECAYGNIRMQNITAGKIGGNFLLSRKSKAVIENLTIETVGSDIVYNRASDLQLKTLRCGDVGGSAFFNDFLTSKSTAGAGDVTIEDFEIGHVMVNGIRSNGGKVLLKDGVFDICDGHGAYAKDGEFTCDSVTFKGSAVGRAVVLVGYNTNTETVAVFRNTTITGGARGLQNHAIVTWESGTIYGNKSSGKINIGAGVKNSGQFTMLGGTIRDNRAKSSGGGIYNEGTLIVKGGTIKNNSSEQSGGGIRNSVKGTVKVSGGLIYNNTAKSYGGGIASAGRLTFSGGTVSYNSCAKSGGGIAITGDTTGKQKGAGVGYLTGGTVKNNKSTASGGGVYLGSSAQYGSLEGVKIKNNKTSDNTSGGGVSSLSKLYIYKGTVITGNKSGTYGGGVYNSITKDGTKHGTMYIKGGTITGNTAGSKGGGGVYNRGVMTISGGTIKNNSIVENVNGKSVYNSGDLTITGGTYDGLSAKPYDVYSYKGSVSIKGSPKLGSLYKAALSDTYIKGKISVDKNIKYYMTRYTVGTQAFKGKTADIKAGKAKFEIKDVVTAYIPGASDKTTKYVNNNGVITRNGVDLNAQEAILLDSDGNEILRGLLSTVVSEAADGDTIKIISDAVVDESLTLSYFSSTASNEGKSKTINITDDGKPHTISIASGDEAAFYIASSAGGGKGKPSDSGYYKTYVTVNLSGNGLTFKGTEDMHSAAFFVSGPATFNVTGNVRFESLRNLGGWDQDENGDYLDKPTHSSGNNGGAISTGANSVLNITGATFTDCGTSRGGAIYSNGKTLIKNCAFENNTTEDVAYLKGGASAVTAGNGAAVYVTSTGDVTAINCTFTDNEAVNGGAIYVFGGKLTVKNSVFKDNNANDAGGGQAIYVTNKSAEGDSPAVYGSAVLSGITVSGSGEDRYGILQKSGASLTVSGKMVVDSINVSDTLNLGGALTSGSDIWFQMPSDKYLPGEIAVTGSGIAESYTYLRVNNEMLTVNAKGILEGELAVAQIGDNLYATFDEALAAAMDGDTIMMLMDAGQNNASDATANVNHNITIDLAGHKVYGEGAHSRSIIRIAAGAELTIKDSVGGGKMVNLAGKNNSGGVISVNGGTLNLVSGTLTGTLTGVNVNANNGGAVRVQSGGTFNMSGGSIEDCAATNGGAVFLNNATFNMTGGEIKNITTTCATSGAIHPRGGAVVNISKNAKIDCDFSVANVDETGTAWSGNPGTIVLSGGYYKTNEFTQFLADGYSFVPDTSVSGYSYTVATENEAKIGSTMYASAAEAFAAAQDGDTVVLLRNAEIDTSSGSVSVTKNVTLDLAGYNLTSVGEKALFSVSGTLNVTDSDGKGSIIPSADATEARFAIVSGTLNLKNAAINGGGSEAAKGAISVSGTVNMQGGTLSGFTATGGAGAVSVESGGHFRMTGGTVTGNSSAAGSADINAASGTTTLEKNDAAILISGGTVEATLSKAGTYIEDGCFSQAALDSFDDPATVIAGGHYKAPVINTAEGVECVEDTETAGYPYKVAAPEYVQPGGTEGKDIEEIDPFD
ncbi:MAG: hypothetical protein IJU01_03635 [Lachnospiraceae bacterium]|nr:hypothetical protein [Lachnospiraceae bacterium]